MPYNYARGRFLEKRRKSDKVRKNLPGTSGAVFGKLGKAGINVIASAQGGEELSISLVLDQKDIDKATEVLK